MEYKIQTPGELRYENLNKPVYYPPGFLASLAKKKMFKIEEEGHDSPKLAEALELFWQDGALWLRTDEKLDMKGYGFSTSIKNWELVEEKDRYIITKGELDSIARTKNPKDVSTYLNNSDDNSFTIITLDNDNGDDKLTEDKIEELTQQVGSYKTQLDTKQQEIDNLKQSDGTKQQELDDIKQKYQQSQDELKKYKDQEQKKAEKIAEELAGEDEELQELYKDMPLEKLQILKSKQEDENQQNQHDTGFQGAGDSTTGDDQNNGDTNNDDEPPESYEDYAKKAGGW